MLAARVSSARRATRIVRGFASVVDTAGLKVAAIDNGQPTSAVTILVKAGSRYETKPGVAHVLKNFAFKSTAQRSALGTIREAELQGGVLSSSLTREHLAITAEFLRGDEAFFVDLLASLITSPKFTRYELEESVLPSVTQEIATANADPATHALELAHALAFRAGLGSSLFAPAPESITAEDVKAFASTTFAAKDSIAVLGTGIDQTILSKLVEKHFKSGSGSGGSSGASAPASKYFGGESRALGHGGLETVFLGYGTAGASTAELAVLAAHLSASPHVKWGQSTSPVSASLPAGTTVQSVLLPYSDATLFGLLVQGPTAEGVKDAAAAAAKALKEAGSVKGDDLKRAIAKAKFVAASTFDARDGVVFSVGPKVLSGSATSLDSALKAFDSVNESAISKAASAFSKSKPTYVAVGNTSVLPHADELGL